MSSITFGDDITIYSHWKKGRGEAWVRTQVQAVSWYGKQAVTVGDSGLTTADQYTVRIRPWSLAEYVTPDEWGSYDAAPVGVWTVQAGDVVVKGLVDDEVTGITQITNKYTDCFTVTAVHDNRREMLQHLKVEGK